MTLGTSTPFLAGAGQVELHQEEMPGTTGTFGKIFGIGSWSTILWGYSSRGDLGAAQGDRLPPYHGLRWQPLGAAEAGIRVSWVKVWCFIIIAFAAASWGSLTRRIGSMNAGNNGSTSYWRRLGDGYRWYRLTGGRGAVWGIIGDLPRDPGGRAQHYRRKSWFYFFEGVIIWWMAQRAVGN